LPVEETAATEIPTESTVAHSFDQQEESLPAVNDSENENTRSSGVVTVIAVAAGIATVSSIAVLVFYFLYKNRIFPR